MQGRRFVYLPEYACGFNQCSTHQTHVFGWISHVRWMFHLFLVVEVSVPFGFAGVAKNIGLWLILLDSRFQRKHTMQIRGEP